MIGNDSDKSNIEPLETQPNLETKSDVQSLISAKEKENGIPEGILNSIASVESKHKVYAVNTYRKSHNFNSKSDAVKFINTAIRHGKKNISIGCCQLHYASHKKNFLSIDDMLTPEKNVAYAAIMLKKLYIRYGSWEKAIKKYHNASKRHNQAYYNKVMKIYSSYKHS